MHLSIDCYECVVKQAILLAKNVTEDPSIQKQIVKHACSLVQNSDEEIFPTYLQVGIEQHVRNVFGDKDFYIKEKQDSIALINKAMPYIQEYLQENDFSTESLIRVAIIGNHMDNGVYGSNIAFSKEIVKNMLEKPYGHSDLEMLVDKLKTAKKLLIIADNVGEHLLDKLLMEHLNKNMEVVYAVRGSYILNDITLDYAIRDGIDKVAKLITTGSNHAGVVPSESGKEFLQEFLSADVVIAKGMGNFETCELYPRDVFCILKAKCSHVAAKAGVKKDDLVIKHYIAQ